MFLTWTIATPTYPHPPFSIDSKGKRAFLTQEQKNSPRFLLSFPSSVRSAISKFLPGCLEAGHLRNLKIGLGEQIGARLKSKSFPEVGHYIDSPRLGATVNRLPYAPVRDTQTDGEDSERAPGPPRSPPAGFGARACVRATGEGSRARRVVCARGCTCGCGRLLRAGRDSPPPARIGAGCAAPGGKCGHGL